VNQVCIRDSGYLLDIGGHLLLQFFHDGGLHGLKVRQAEELPGFQGRAVDFDINLHFRS